MFYWFPNINSYSFFLFKVRSIFLANIYLPVSSLSFFEIEVYYFLSENARSIIYRQQKLYWNQDDVQKYKMREMDRTMAECPVNLCRISATGLGNSQSHKTFIFTCNLIKILMAKTCSHSWTMISFMLVLCARCRTIFPLASVQDPHFEGCKSYSRVLMAFLVRKKMTCSSVTMTPLEVHIYTNPSSPSSWNEILCQLLFPLVLGFFFQSTGYVKSMYNEQGVLHPILAHPWLTGCSETCSGIHGTVTESIPCCLMLKTLFTSLCLPFPPCSMSVIIQASFHEWFYKSSSISRLIIPCCKR